MGPARTRASVGKNGVGKCATVRRRAGCYLPLARCYLQCSEAQCSAALGSAEQGCVPVGGEGVRELGKQEIWPEDVD